MAIIEGLRGLEVCVHVKGTKAVEFDDPDQTNSEDKCSTATKYIESIDDAQFYISFRVTDDYVWGDTKHSVCFRIWIDGHFRQGSLRNNTGVSIYKMVQFYDPSSDQWTEAQLKFAPVNINDDTRKEIIQRDTKISKTIGLIRIEVVRIVITGHKPARRIERPQQQLDISEKALKGKELSHGTSFSAPKICAEPIHSSTKLVDDGPIGIFNFLYRSKEDLRRLLIIPRSPAQSPTQPMALKGGLKSLSQDEIIRLAQERYDELKASANVKREHKPFIKRDPDGEVVHMESRPVKRLKTKPEEGDEVIDLLDD